MFQKHEEYVVKRSPIKFKGKVIPMNRRVKLPPDVAETIGDVVVKYPPEVDSAPEFEDDSLDELLNESENKSKGDK